MYSAKKTKRLRAVVRLPLKHLEKLDEYAEMVAQTRSGFLQIFLDTYMEHATAFVMGWLAKDKERERVEKKKVMLVLAEHQVEMIRECAKAMGKPEEAFLEILLDDFSEWMEELAQTMYTRIGYYREKVLRNSQMAEAKKAARSLGMTISRPSGSDS